MATVPQLDRMLSEAARSDCAEVLVDMAQVEFIDAAGIGALIAAAGRALAAGARLKLLAVSPAVERVLELVGLDSAFVTAGAAFAGTPEQLSGSSDGPPGQTRSLASPSR